MAGWAGADQGVRFPDLAPTPPPTPLPVPRPTEPETIQVPAGEWYVFEADVPLLVFDAPRGRLVVTRDEGPVRLKGRFVGGGGRVETRTYKGPHVYTAEAAHVGPVELIVVPVGAKTEAEAVRKLLVSGGTPQPGPPPGPGPPPTPGPGPAPTPGQQDPIGAGGFAVMIVFDQTNTVRPPAQQSVIYGKAVRDYLEAKCVRDPVGPPAQKAYRVFPENTVGSQNLWINALARKGGKDWIMIGTGTSGYSGPLPKTEAEALTLLKKYGGE